MAVITSQHSFDILSVDLSRLSNGLTGWDFSNNANVAFGGSSHEDVYEFSWALPGYDYSSRYYGEGFTVSGSGALTGGTVDAYLERVWTGSDWWELWRMTDASIDAARLYDAIQTPTTSDDRRVYAQALSGNDSFTLSINGDRAFGYAGRDTIHGGAGNDTLAGQGGQDWLYGDEGSDRLAGGGGADHLSGGAGADVFLFRNTAEIGGLSGTGDLITDFQHGTDRIDLRDIDASSVLAGNNAFQWRGEAAIGTSPQGEVSFQQLDRAGTAQDVTLVRIDTDGDSAAEAVLTLTGLHDLTAGDFIF